ncbi:hypothetical protein BJY18_001342 [Amycolatopsis jiangsuensis]|uniref:Uncharacterized protein n=2 Tax=Amycolatopsis jiangsuensis TaxID=1181879 RepID=A0A840IR54_9PSEU|nr:hypothetical protein [Amycolatopsis jiangsuensis]
MGRYTKDHLTKIIDEKIPNVTPAQRQEIFDKFDKYSNLGKPDLLKLLGPDKAARFENTIKTVTDPAFGGRGFVSKGTIEFIKSLGTVAKEVTPDNSDSSDDSGDS